jgi:two-component system response regulator MtrA
VSDRVLLVEDDQALGAQIVGHLRDAGLDPTWLRDGDQAGRVEIGTFRLVVLDLMLPGTYGLDLLKRWRAGSDVPVIVLTARNDTHDKVRALGLGADDYVTKPFWPEELIARIRARLRRPGLQRGDVLEVGALKIDLGGRTATLGGEGLELTRVEMDLLAALAKRAGSAVTRRALVEAALDPDKQGGERTLDVHVSRLRKKLGEVGPEIATVWGIGYKLVAKDGGP